MDDPTASDGATGLPPLEEPEQETTLVVAAWDVSIGTAARTSGGEVEATVPVRYLHARGLIEGGPTGVEWAQIEHAMEIAAAVAKGTATDLEDRDARWAMVEGALLERLYAAKGRRDPYGRLRVDAPPPRIPESVMILGESTQFAAFAHELTTIARNWYDK